MAKAMLLSLLFCTTEPVRGSQPVTSPSFIELQAAYLYNIAKYIEWPAAHDQPAIRLCVIDNDAALYQALEDKLNQRKVHSKPLRIERIPSDQVNPQYVQQSCNMVYLNSEVADGLVDASKQNPRASASLLWISSPQVGFEEGVLIRLKLERNRLVIYLSKAELNAVDFGVGAALLSVAKLR